MKNLMNVIIDRVKSNFKKYKLNRVLVSITSSKGELNPEYNMRRAVEENRLDLVKAIVKKDIDIDGEYVLQALFEGKISIVRYFFSLGFDLNYCDDEGYSLLHAACVDMVNDMEDKYEIGYIQASSATV